MAGSTPSIIKERLVDTQAVSHLWMIRFALFILIVFMPCCDSDPFGLTKKTVASNYKLQYFDQGDIYFLVKKGDDSQGGVFQGVVNKIGWSKHYIVCDVTKQYRGDKDGIYAISLGDGTIEGPIEPPKLYQDPRFVEIKLEDVKTVYDRL